MEEAVGGRKGGREENVGGKEGGMEGKEGSADSVLTTCKTHEYQI